MTSSGEQLRCSQCAMGDAERYGGPCAIVHGLGTMSEDIAYDVARRCGDYRVSTRVRAIDDLGDLELVRYSSLVLSLPATFTGRNVGDVLQPFADLVTDYRLRRPAGLPLIVEGSREWFDVGPIRLIGKRIVLHHPIMANALAQACTVDYVEDDDAAIPDMFTAYCGLGIRTAPADPHGTDASEENLERVWQRVRSWGVSDLGDVPRMLACLKKSSEFYENAGNRYPQLYRPNPKVRRNRVDIILNGPDEVIGDPKAWAENGARVWRKIRDELAEVVPDFARPGNQGNKRDAVKALRSLYRDLDVLGAYLQNRYPPSPGS